MIQVLLSTFNGEAHLRPQLDSLLAQDASDVRILARDDGSTDSTVRLMGEYAARWPSLQVIQGENLGYARSFLELLRRSERGADFVAFCDQDDVWLAGKLSRAAEMLAPHSGRPALYCGRRIVVDEALTPRGETARPGRGLSFENALVECPVVGCTTVLNRAARDLIAADLPEFAFSHDWWCYLTVAGFGALVFDPEPRILYRRHASNTVGTARGPLEAWRMRLRRLRRYWGAQPMTRQAGEFQRIYGARLPERPRRTLQRFLTRRGLLGRMAYALAGEVHRQAPRDDRLLKLLILLDRV